MDRKDLEEFEQRQSDLRQRLEEMSVEIAELDSAINRLLAGDVPAWDAPEWLKPGWIAMDKSGQWWWFSNEPSDHGNAFFSSGGQMNELTHLNWTPPQCSDWEQSKRKVH